MDLDADFDAELRREGVRFTARDADLLRAVHERGSLNAAATALGRSYSRCQRRVVELEDAFGRLVDRRRGGSGGGGSSLTDRADDLLAEFDRLEAEFAGVAEVAETVLGSRRRRDGSGRSYPRRTVTFASRSVPTPSPSTRRGAPRKPRSALETCSTARWRT
jgi:molybdate transport system regulatory protein